MATPAKSLKEDPQVGGNAPDIDIGISAENRKKISESLMVSLADAFTLYLKTHNFHFNITGEMFNSLHTMFETQYNEQWMAFDEIAERIRALGYNVPASYDDFQRLTSIKPGTKVEHTDWREMVRQLVVGNEAVARAHRKSLEIADKAGDDPTVDMLTQRLAVHEKNAWMLRALLQ
ncbi:Dps family protein [Noviluteimonas gilva]|uniref:DNA starvation/stationary phase protection protein n=1 Tax=Noviluteimonas gilva TaxID=2682097 RepID=A0A7C9M5F6_9GAMM|nr:Dps family protein [Lysobacter gilvus]MUV15706.1 DNA starvation/stationary phase protection protein [Lysobacter gilvus]